MACEEARNWESKDWVERYSEGLRRGWTDLSYFTHVDWRVETGREGMKNWYRSIDPEAVGSMAQTGGGSCSTVLVEEWRGLDMIIVVVVAEGW